MNLHTMLIRMKRTTQIYPLGLATFRARARSFFQFTGMCVLVLLVGCREPLQSVKEVQRQADQQQRAVAEVDHLKDAFEYVATAAELDAQAANVRVASLLNAWLDLNPMAGEPTAPKLLGTLDPGDAEFCRDALGMMQGRFVPADVEYLKLTYLLNQITAWVRPESSRDPLYADWIDRQEERLGREGKANLARAAELFDWTMRNLQHEPLVSVEPAPPGPNLPTGFMFQGAGYRQTTMQALYRGTGDPWQRSRVFIQLCRQAKIDACMLAVPASGAESGTTEPREWAVGVLIGKEVFLFDAGLGLPIPGPEQEGIATLAEARNDPSVLRRLNVQGFFDYPLDSTMVQQTVALIDAEPEAMASRMMHLENGLAGNLRMVLAVDVDVLGEKFDAVPGIAGARLWSIPVKSRMYEIVMAQAIRDNQQIAMWTSVRWGMLTGKFPLALARWEHLKGSFELKESESGDEKGARVMYMDMRHPEFDIDALESNVDLQQQYGVRRGLGQSPEMYNALIQNIQGIMRLTKRAASYWISLIHYDLGDFDVAKIWFEKRVLDDQQMTPWRSAARYNLARTLERLGETEQAIELYKTIGDSQEHGNRLRARLLGRTSEPAN
jgi:hypothetical protein